MRLFLSLILFGQSLVAQVQDDFSDGDLFFNPPWLIDTNHFEVVNALLRLNAPSKTDTSILVTESEASINATWNIDVNLNFNPSSSNYLKVYLTALNADLRSDNNSYFIKVGGSKDDVSLYRQDGRSETLLIKGIDDLLNVPYSQIDLLVERDSSYVWNLYVDTSGNQNFVFQGSVTDNTYRLSKFFGFFCRYTSSRSDKFSFDNINVTGSPYIDRISPKISSHEPIDSNTWIIHFSEKIDTSNLNLNSFKLISPGLKFHEFIVGSDLKSLVVKSNSNFPHGKMMTLILDSIYDMAGNVLKSDSILNFYNYVDSFKHKDLVINEIMPDPEPNIKLPVSEYIEIYNRSSHHIYLNSFRLSDIKDTTEFPHFHLEPNHYVLLIDKNDSAKWKDQKTNIIEIDLPSLNNDMDRLYVFNSKSVIDSMSYISSQFKINDNIGGRSLELIDPNFICSDSTNWKLCSNDDGGSPGGLNYSYNASKEYEEIEFKSVLSINDSSIILSILGQANKTSFKHISFIPTLPYKNLNWMGENRIKIDLEAEFLENQEYFLIVDSPSDCINRNYDEISFIFVAPSQIKENDLVINEILFNPKDNGSDFIEIYNTTDRYFDLNKLFISNNSFDSVSSLSPIISIYKPILPGQYLAVTDDSINVLSKYPHSGTQNILQSKIPNYTNEKGVARILDHESKTIDVFAYNESMHFPLINNNEGVSLERISPYSPTNDNRNWTSAASSVNYASPGYENSQKVKENSQSFSIHPNIFSPDNDGYNDLATIYYNFNKAGYLGSINIYDNKGVHVRKLVSNELLGSKGSFSWDGLDEKGNRVPIGYYLILLDCYHQEGDFQKERTTVVVANKFK